MKIDNHPTGIFFIILLFICMSVFSAAQDLSSLKDNKPLTFSGNVTAKQGFMSYGELRTGVSPWNYLVSGNVNLCFYGIVDVPFSGTYNKQEKRLDCPEYKEYGVSPRYRSLTLHGGYRSLNLSAFTLSGTTFLGGAAELKPSGKPYELTILYGRFKKPEDYSSVAIEDIDRAYINAHPYFDRRGYAAKIALKGAKNRTEFIMFRAFDLYSEDGIIPGLNIAPAENLCLSAVSKTSIGKNIMWANEFAWSAFNENTLLNANETNQSVFSGNFFRIFQNTPQSQFKKVLVSDLKIRMKKQTIGLGYRRIDPGYKTLGMPYISNDLESFTLNLTRAFFKNKLNLSGNTGVQRNNLDRILESTGMKYISGANISWNICKGKTAAFAYSNYSANLIPARIVMTDSIRYFQVNENYTISLNSSSEKEAIKSSFSFLASYQKAKAARDGTQNETGIVTFSLSHNLIGIKSGFNLNSMISANKTDNSLNGTTTCIPSLTAGKSLFRKKAGISLSFSDAISFSEAYKPASMYNIRTGYNHQILKNASAGMDFSKSFKTGNSPFRPMTQANIYIKISC